MLDHLVPAAPGWSLDWQGLDRELECIRALKGCPQDPVHHAEGDVWVHTRMVLECLLAAPGWRALPERERTLTFWTAVLHDIGKPACTRREPGGRITSRGHSLKGAGMARRLLWRAGMPLADRELVCALIVRHQVPFFLLERDDPLKLTAGISVTGRCDLLRHHAEADIRGRRCADQRDLLERVELFADYARGQDCYDRPYPFPSNHTRFTYFRSDGRAPDHEAYDDTKLEVTVLSGLPASGKSTWIADHAGGLPVVSLDRLRHDMRVAPDADQGRVVAAARELARTHLRQAQDFIWNATNLSRRVRQQVIGLCADYDARIRIVYLEAPEAVLRERNRARKLPVPEATVARMLERWEVPDATEAHRVEWIDT
jgi:predicted kinase